MNRGRAIFLCDETGNMGRPWAEAGYECYCVDIAHSIRRTRVEMVGEGSLIYQWGDIRSWAPPPGSPLVFVFGFPPCTNLAVSGARDHKTKGLPMLFDGLLLFNTVEQLCRWAGVPYGMENPVGVIGSYHIACDQTFHPYEYAGYLEDPTPEAYTKKTCLWTGGGFVMPPKKAVDPALGSKMHRLPPSKDRASQRSATPQGFAKAVFLANAPHLRERKSA